MARDLISLELILGIDSRQSQGPGLLHGLVESQCRLEYKVSCCRLKILDFGAGLRVRNTVEGFGISGLGIPILVLRMFRC